MSEQYQNFTKHLKIIGAAVTLYACYEFYSTMKATTKSSVSIQSTQTDNKYNLNNWNGLKQELASTKEILLQKTKSEGDKAKLNEQIQNLQSFVTGLQETLTTTKNKLDETQVSNADNNKHYQQTIQSNEQQIQQLKHELKTNQTNTTHLNTCMQQLKISNDELNQLVDSLLILKLDSAKNAHSEIKKLSQDLTYIKLSAANNKIEHYNNELLDMSKHTALRNQKLHHIDYILDWNAFRSVLQHLFGQHVQADNVTNAITKEYLPEAIILETYRIYHRYLNMKVSLQVDSASSNTFIFEKQYDQVMKWKTNTNLSCFPFGKYNKLIVGFQIRASDLSEGDELLQIISTVKFDDRIGFRWICDGGMDGKDTDNLMASDYYFTNGDLLGLFVDDDHFTYAFRNGVYVATGSWFPSTKRFFEEQYGCVNIKTDGEVEIECDMSNIQWTGAVCQHLKMDRDYYRTLNCNLCDQSKAAHFCLPITEYQSKIKAI